MRAIGPMARATLRPLLRGVLWGAALLAGVSAPAQAQRAATQYSSLSSTPAPDAAQPALRPAVARPAAPLSRDHGREIPARAVASHAERPGLTRCCPVPSRQRILRRRRKWVFRRQSVSNAQHAQPGAHSDHPAQRIVRVQPAHDEPAAVQEHQRSSCGAWRYVAACRDSPSRYLLDCNLPVRP